MPRRAAFVCYFGEKFRLVAELVHLKVDLIVVTGGSTWIHAAKSATKTIPIVMVNSVLDPVEDGLVESLARPGGNVTGLTLLSRELARLRGFAISNTPK